MLPPFDRARVLVAGDVMLDRYWHGATSRISPEAPVPIVHVRDVEERLGGAANVAANILALGASPVLCGIVGDDEAADTLERLLQAHQIEAHLVRVSGRATVTKMRVVSRHQQLIRLDFEDGFGGEEHSRCLAHYVDALSSADAVVLSDYGKGALSEASSFIVPATAAGKPVFVDPKASDFTRYRGATIITPNLAEFETVVGVCRDLDELAVRAEALCRELQLEALLITRSDQGMTLVRPDERPVHVAARSREVYDVTGAGDTVIGVLAAAVAAGESQVQAMELANLAAGVVVTKLGTATASPEALELARDESLPSPRGVVTEDELRSIVERARARKESIVMTNGCFDFLHAGHVSYLSRAKVLGDRLVVAVNDDASVKRLKGHGRPVNSLKHRMAVLAGLEAVDWVVPFGEDTPERIIGDVLPDVLVKGGDYRVEEIAGGDRVRASGGQVVVMAIEEECSTSAIIESLGRPASKSS